jgi:hypothetical protein
MKTNKKPQQQPEPPARSGAENPELIEKFYKQIINSFGYAYPAKTH